MLATALSAATITVQPATTTASPGDTVTLDINISGAFNLYAFQFDVLFIPGVLSVSSIHEGSFLSGQGTTLFVPGTIDNPGGTLAYTADTLLGAVPGANGSGLLANMTFQTVTAGTSPITLSNIILLNSSLSAVNTTTVNGSVMVQGSSAVTPEPATWSLWGLALGFALLRKRRAAT